MIMKTLKELQLEQKDLLIEKIKLDRFFTKYLDKFSSKMHPENTNTPIWKLYNTKLEEYEDVNRRLRTNEYYVRKYGNVQNG